MEHANKKPLIGHNLIYLHENLYLTSDYLIYLHFKTDINPAIISHRVVDLQPLNHVGHATNLKENG